MTSPRPSTSHPTPLWTRRLRLAAAHIMVWLTLTFLATLTSFNDDLRAGLMPDFIEIFRYWSQSTTALALLAYLLYFCLSRWPAAYQSGMHILLSYVVLLMVLLPLQLLFVIRFVINERGQSPTWNAIQTQLLIIDRYTSLMHLSSVTAVFCAVVMIKIWQNKRQREQIFAQERAASLGLQLELEEQKLRTLRAQLEPHFMFNALNAISALVLSEHKKNALQGISDLSELLRYALLASEKNWVTLADELRFIADYLALQKLRYGERLQVTISPIPDNLLDADCLPLLLQPLIENALRHDLDCHHDASHLQLQFTRQHDHYLVTISNPIAHTGTSPNPGAGLGLRNTQARLQLAYNGAANMQIHTAQGQFVVTLKLPLYRPQTD
ncbi:MAG: histidine kinase [Burkholderiales bacterium]|nr:histidine kinase [Burkholderiales bacterium]